MIPVGLDGLADGDALRTGPAAGDGSEELLKSPAQG